MLSYLLLLYRKQLVKQHFHKKLIAIQRVLTVCPYPYFPTLGLNTERDGVSLCFQSKCGKIRTRKTPNTDTFHEYFKEDENMKHFLFDLILQVNLFSPSIPFLYFWCFQGYIEMEHCQNLVLNNHGMLRSSINKIKIFAYVWLLYICNISHQSSRYFQCQELMR